MIDSKTSLTDVAFIVCTELNRARITAVLTGGSAAQFYAPNNYQSLDLDFIVQFEETNSYGKRQLEDLGYRQENGMYLHSMNPYTIDFPKGPIGIGDDLITNWDTIRRKDQLLHILDRTDSVRDRLCAYYFWNDRQSLAVALAVARSGPVDLNRIGSWSKREGELVKYRDFETGLAVI